jgi:hypothetical protein
MHASTLISAALLALAPLASAHARVKFPTPLGNSGDNAYNAPLAADGSDFPCKLQHIHPSYASAPAAADWAAGSKAYFELQPNAAPRPQEGSMAAHSGGSCQASISYDQGKTFKVLHSYEGGCPKDVELGSNLAGEDQRFEFDIPAEAKSGEALFAWTWVAVSGNRNEFYMNCAKVNIEGSGSSTLNDLPDMFVGDLTKEGVVAENECRSTAGSALKYPNPGNAVTVKEVAGIPFASPTEGTCALVGSGAPAPEQPSGGDSETGTPEETTEEGPVEIPEEVVAEAGAAPIEFEMNGQMCSITCRS